MNRIAKHNKKESMTWTGNKKINMDMYFEEKSPKELFEKYYLYRRLQVLIALLVVTCTNPRNPVRHCPPYFNSPPPLLKNLTNTKYRCHANGNAYIEEIGV